MPGNDEYPFLEAGHPALRPGVIFRGDPSRVVLRPFTPADNPFPTQNAPRSRVGGLVARICTLDAQTASRRLALIIKRLEHRHDDVEMLLSRRYYEAIAPDGEMGVLTDDQIKLIGSYLLEEYAVEDAALFNPSIVAHPDQQGVAEGDLRVLLSLRAVGEGHVSSIVFRVGTVHPGGAVDFAAPAPRLVPAKATWIPGGGEDDPGVRLDFGADRDLSSLVLFPVAERHRHGLEDLRLTRFIEDDGAVTYYGTYTGVGRDQVRQEFLRTTDFRTFDLLALQGRYAGDKGMALFPRRIGGYCAMLGRQDHENIWLLTSNDLNRWDSGGAIIRPRWPWEFVQIGTCGPPIELEEGWLVITHGVGAIRSYCLGACLLDKNDPAKLLARTRHPIIVPAEGMRDGYVPNVVYSCGALLHDDWLVLPYGVADSYSTMASVRITDLLRAME